MVDYLVRLRIDHIDGVALRIRDVHQRRIRTYTRAHHPGACGSIKIGSIRDRWHPGQGTWLIGGSNGHRSDGQEQKKGQERGRGTSSGGHDWPETRIHSELWGYAVRLSFRSLAISSTIRIRNVADERSRIRDPARQ